MKKPMVASNLSQLSHSIHFSRSSLGFGESVHCYHTKLGGAKPWIRSKWRAFCRIAVTVSATRSITGWTWSQSTNTSFQARPRQRSRPCTHRWEPLWTTSFTNLNALPQLMRKVRAQNPAAFRLFRFHAGKHFLQCVIFLSSFFPLSRFNSYENRLETHWFSSSPLRRCFVVTEGPSQSHVPLRSSQPSGKVPDGPECCIRWRAIRAQTGPFK